MKLPSASAKTNPILSAIAPVLRSFSGEGFAKADSKGATQLPASGGIERRYHSFAGLQRLLPLAATLPQTRQ